MGRRRLLSFTMTQTRNGVPHLFHCWDQVSEKIRAANDIRLFLDFDGTLVPYCDRPEDVKLSGECRRILARLGRHRRAHVAIVSGRRNAALRKYVRVPHIQFLGLFGWEQSGRPALPRKTRKALRSLRSVLATLSALFPGIRVEDKGVSYAVHFRGAPPEAQRGVQAWVRRLLISIHPDFRAIRSNYACEIVPRQVQGKGVAMREFIRGLRAPILPIYVGDDLTDEPAFAALRRGITVRVAPVSRTKARFRLRNPEEVRIFLERLEEEFS
jgi:trehalose 6-phosphate phosphatase